MLLRHEFCLPIYCCYCEVVTLALLSTYVYVIPVAQIYRIRFTDLLNWVLNLPNFEGKKDESNEGHLEMIQSSWVYEWRDNQ